MASCGTFQKLSPLSLLAHLSDCYDSAHLKVTSGSVSWSIYLEEGKITYASHSVAPFDRLDCHLHRLGHKIPSLTSEIRAQLSLIFETDTESQSIPAPEYQAISWLVNHHYLTTTQAAELITGLVKEVVETFLLVKTGSYEFGKNSDDLSVFCRLELQPIVNECQQRLQGWKFLGPQVWSPYQRLYFSNRHKIEQQTAPEIQQKLGTLLKGFSFRHLAVILNQDELQLAKSIYQYIVDETILLQDPYQPFDQLPRTFEQSHTEQNSTVKVDEKPPLSISNIPERHIATPLRKIGNPNQSTQFSPQVSKKVESNLDPKELVKGKKNFEFTSPTNTNLISPTNTNFTPSTNINKVDDRTNNTNFTPSTNINKVNDRTNNPFVAKPLVNLPNTKPSVNLPDQSDTSSVLKSTYKIVCVDDSPAILQELNRCLEDEIFSVHTISNPIKALMQIIKIKPNLILLDVNMAGIDGYELCRLLRNHTLFKSTPIIMVTANTGIINRVKARVVGASGYLTKPFTQSDLLKIVFKHLT